MNGFSPPTPGPDDPTCVMWFDFEQLTANNLFYDRSRNGLHASPQAGFTAPAFGHGRSARGKGFCNFTGAANAYATLPLRFYDVAPTGLHTYVYACRTALTSYMTLFSCANAGPTAGLWLAIFSNPGVSEFVTTYITPGGVAAYVRQTTPQWTGTNVVGISTVDTVPKTTRNGSALTTTWTAGAYGAPVYDATVPWIGRTAVFGGPYYFVGPMYFLALFRDWTPNDREAEALSQYLRDWI